jgi:hypothetical protein
VRQGDPLSPFLFVLVIEAVSRMISAIYSRGLILGFSMGTKEHDRVEVSHLLFVDDRRMLAKLVTWVLFLFVLKRSLGLR